MVLSCPIWKHVLCFLVGLFGDAFAQYSTIPGELHPCTRPCVKGDNRICEYTFNIYAHASMSRFCTGCDTNVSSCYQPLCVPADGVPRSMTLANRQFPGPDIQVCLDDTISVKIVNRLLSDSVVIHFHGPHQNGTNNMDGVHAVTQLAVLPGQSFTPTFKANPAGTFIWHSHIGTQRADGLFGKLVVRKPIEQEPNRHRYDVDDPSHVIIASDWIHWDAWNAFTVSVADMWQFADKRTPFGWHINGKGRVWEPPSLRTNTPLAWFNVTSGERYRFRLIYLGHFQCSAEFFIDHHDLRIIAVDGKDVQETKVQSLVIHSGQRIDFIVKATQDDYHNYWIRMRGLDFCENIKGAEGDLNIQFGQPHQAAVLHYDTAPISEPLYKKLTWSNAWSPGKQFQKPFYNLEPKEDLQKQDVPLLSLTSLDPDDITLTQRHPDVSLYFEIGFTEASVDQGIQNGFRNLFLSSAFFPWENGTTFSPSINNISMTFPVVPLVDLPCPENLCDSNIQPSNCIGTGYCECPHIGQIPFKRVVEIVIVSRGQVDDPVNMAHPFHLHG